MNLDRWGGRRWLASLILTAISTALCVAGHLTGAQWVEFQTWVYGLFVFGNVSQRGLEAARDVKTAKPVPDGAG